MKKRVLTLTLALVLAFGLAVPASAEHFTGGDNWRVRFTEGQEMESTFRSQELTEAVSGLQPGDDIVFSLTLQNDNENSTDWYMSNKVLYSLEDRSANAATAGGAYTYELIYTDKNGEERVLYSSDTVGGETITAAGEGLHEATDALQDFFYLESLAQGDKAGITLTVALEGETQGNDYQDTLADLAMNFAVELTPGVGNEYVPGTPHVIVKTGDQNDLFWYYIAMIVSGIVFLALAIDSIRRRRKARQEGKV
ncbi:MAG: hypothetical protein E7423_08885 [Ruminococcaceae bacterium]|jgi:hypothetical protein|nr:hypothetical protein [Oscillospiraceae bacterium]